MTGVASQALLSFQSGYTELGLDHQWLMSRVMSILFLTREGFSF